MGASPVATRILPLKRLGSLIARLCGDRGAGSSSGRKGAGRLIKTRSHLLPALARHSSIDLSEAIDPPGSSGLGRVDGTPAQRES
jgi:hypothetical protein